MASVSLSTVDNWKDFEFANLQRVLDEQSSKISASQEEGTASRKALSAKTKAFRKLGDDEKLNEIRGLLKGYQSEIDALTNRCKFAESCFMNVYKSLALLPDPEPLLNSKQLEIDQLKSELASSSDSTDKDSTLARELERQTLRAAQLEKQLKASSDNGVNKGDGSQNPVNQSDSNITSPDTSNSSAALMKRIDELETKLAGDQSQLSKVQASLKDQTALTQKHQQDLQNALAKLAIQQDYDEIKKELSELRAREVSPGLDGDTSLPRTGSDRDIAAQRRSIKKLEAENKELREQSEILNSDVKKCKSLIAKLEEDLGSVQPSDTFSTISGWTAIPRGGSGGGSTLGGGSSNSSGASAVSNIIVQQRDRYKKRMHELEEKSHAHEIALTQTQKELESVKRESYTLYDRIRQLQALSPSSGTGAPPSLPTPGSKSLYEPLPEQQLKDLDLGRRTMGLSPLNAKLVEYSARAVVDQKFRGGVAIYAAAIHLLALLGIIF